MGTGYKLKGKAMNLFAKLRPSDSEQSPSGSDSPTLASPSSSRSASPTKSSASGAPPRGPRAPGQARPGPNVIEQDQTPLAQSLGALNLDANSAAAHQRQYSGPAYGHPADHGRDRTHVYAPQHRHTNSAPNPNGPFVGGFTPNSRPPPPPPRQQYASQAGPGPGPLPHPPTMQFPTPAGPVDSVPSLTMQYAAQHTQPQQAQHLVPYATNGAYGAPPSRPYSAPGPPGFPHPATSPYPSPYPTPGSSPAHTPMGTAPYASHSYPAQPPPSTSTPNFFPPPPAHAGRPLPAPNVYGNTNAFGATPPPSSPTRPILNTNFNSPSAGTKPHAKPGRLRASSTPPTPVAGVSGVSGQIQCSGVTKAGKRCTRLVKGGPALVSVWGAASPTTGNVERFCHQHAKELMGPSGFYARRQHRDGQQGQGLQEWIDFADYIPPYLHPDTQVALRVEMEKPRSQSDVEGFIYSFEIRDPKDPAPPTISLKVGRAVNVVKRMNQWGKQCGSKEQVLRGWYPGEVDHDSDGADDSLGQSLMKGRVKAGGRGVWCHRLERLIHLELADLAVHAPYLEPGWEAFTKGAGQGNAYAAAHPGISGGGGIGGNPSASASVISISSSSSGSGSPTSTPAKSKKKAAKGSAARSRTPAKSKKDRFLANGLGNGGGGAPCKDCGQVHKEIFEFARVPKGPKGKKGKSKHPDYYGMEWEGIVKRVVDQWGEFVKNYVQ